MQLTVTEIDAGKRIDAFISENSDLSRARIQKLIDDKSISLDGSTTSKSYRVKCGDVITIFLPEPEPSEAQPEDIPLDIVYEDDDLIVINKPKGMVVHPAAGNESGTLVNALLHHCKGSLSGIGGVVRPGIVHRIDKDTSGLLIVAKNDEAHIDLSAQIKEHCAARIYHAIALGALSDRTIDLPIGRHPTDRKRMAVVYKNSKPAITHVSALESFCGATYVRCALETGRTHQIRVHLSHIGHPILGDEVYGGVKNAVMKKYGSALCGQCLHAKEISFTHPKTGERMHFETPLPDYFEKILKGLRAEIEKI